MAHRRMSRKAGRKSKKAQKTRKSMRHRLSKRSGLKRGGLSRRVKKGGRADMNCNKWSAACTAQSNSTSSQ